jgi:hypothetical protein
VSVSVRPARSAREQRAFFELPFKHYAHDPMWTPPLLADFQQTLSKKNPLFRDGRGDRELLVAWRGSEPVARVLAHVQHTSNQLHGQRAGFFGYLECNGDEEIARALLDETAAWHRTLGLKVQRGPYELNVSQCIGAMVKGFHEPAALSQSWHPPYLAPLLERHGFQRALTVFTHRLDDVQSCRPDTWLNEKHRTWLNDPSVTLRSWDMDHFERDVRAAMGLLNESFASNWGFVPLSDADVEFFAGPMKRVVRPEITVFLEQGGVPVGVGMALPDLATLFRRMGGRMMPLGWAQFLLGARKLDAAVFQFMATTPKLQSKGLMRVVISELVRRLQKAGFRTLDGTWVSELNPKSRVSIEAMGMREKHTLHIYERGL